MDDVVFLARESSSSSSSSSYAGYAVMQRIEAPVQGIAAAVPLAVALMLFLYGVV